MRKSESKKQKMRRWEGEKVPGIGKSECGSGKRRRLEFEKVGTEGGIRKARETGRQ
jgi:hypothetical protein